MVNKSNGDYIRIQPTTAEDHEKIKNLLVVKKTEHYVFEQSTVIKVVIKGLPANTDLKEKGFAVKTVSQICDTPHTPPDIHGRTQGPQRGSTNLQYQKHVLSHCVNRPSKFVIPRTRPTPRLTSNQRAPLPLEDGPWNLSRADKATVPLRDRSKATSRHLIGQAVSPPEALIGQRRVTKIPTF
ncbi:uncharacterized protein TNCV_4358911 [Trichonephila clavipes]|nr:uncharacterized protein TNCV_4358911 [Trichonephila clavipes]